MNDIHILACETLRNELNLVLKARGCTYPVAWVDSGKHQCPDKLRVCIQEELSKIPETFTTVLLLFGFCGNALVGVKAGSRRLVLPRAADCMPIFLGSQAKREEYGTRTYFFTEGYLHSETSMGSDYKKFFGKYGEKRAVRLMKAMLEHYEKLAIINTGAFNTDAVKSELEEFAHVVELPVSVIPGNLRLIGALLAGNWENSDFVILEPGREFTLEDSLSIGKV